MGDYEDAMNDASRLEKISALKAELAKAREEIARLKQLNDSRCPSCAEAEAERDTLQARVKALRLWLLQHHEDSHEWAAEGCPNCGMSNDDIDALREPAGSAPQPPVASPKDATAAKEPKR